MHRSRVANIIACLEERYLGRAAFAAVIVLVGVLGHGSVAISGAGQGCKISAGSTHIGVGVTNRLRQVIVRGVSLDATDQGAICGGVVEQQKPAAGLGDSRDPVDVVSVVVLGNVLVAYG